MKKKEKKEKKNLEIMNYKEEKENKEQENTKYIYKNTYFRFLFFNYYKYLLKYYNQRINFHYYPFYLDSSSLGYNLLFSSLIVPSFLFNINNINNNKNNSVYITIIILLLINLIIPIFLHNNIYLIESNLSIIKLKIKGIGNKTVFSNTSNFVSAYYPDEVLINGLNETTISPSYNLNQEDNNIELIWNIEIDNTKYIFYQCSDIIEIDLSNFNTSKLRDMDYMFSDCSSLISLNLSNFNTSQVRYMDSMFSGCSSLISLNLSNFNTSQVRYMNSMFSGCSSLFSLNLSNFNTSQVNDMDSMFSGCSSLIPLNLSNFNTSQVRYMDYMFSGCSSLIY